MVSLLSKILLFGASVMAAMAGNVYWSILENDSMLAVVFDLVSGDKQILTYAWLLTTVAIADILIVWLLFGWLSSYEIELVTEGMVNFVIGFVMTCSSVYRESNTLLMVGFGTFEFSFYFISIVLKNRTDSFVLRILNNRDDYSSRFRIAMAFLLEPCLWIACFLTGAQLLVAAVLLYDIDEYQRLTLITFGFRFMFLSIKSLSKLAELLLTFYESVAYYPAHESLQDSTEDDMDLEDEAAVWEAKPYFTKGIEIGASVLEILANLRMVYLLFVYTQDIPVMLLMGMVMPCKSLLMQLNLLKKFMRAANALETAMITATQEELAAADNSCIVCFDTMYSPDLYNRKHPNKPMSKRKYPKKLSCGHILHMGCLKQWLERSDSCPMCRKKVLSGDTIPTTGTPAAQPPAAQPAPPAAVAAAAAARAGIPAQALQPARPADGAEAVAVAAAPAEETGVNNEVQLEQDPNINVAQITDPPTDTSRRSTHIINPGPITRDLEERTLTEVFSTAAEPVDTEKDSDNNKRQTDELVVKVSQSLFLPKYWMALPLRRINDTTYEIPGTSGASLHVDEQ